MYRGAYSVSVASSMVSRAREYSNHLLREPRSVGLRRVLSRPDIATEADASTRISKLYKLLFGRSPTSEEFSLGGDFIQGTAKRSAIRLCSTSANTGRRKR